MLKCLGSSETQIYKKHELGPIYTLTQHFINEFSSAPSLRLKPALLAEICKRRTDFAPAVILLKNLLIEGEKAFVESKGDRRKNYDLIALDAILAEVPAVFFRYLGSLQGLTASPTCLADHVKNYKYLTERFYYLESEMTPKELFKEKDKIEDLFNSLKKFDSYIEICKQDRKALDEKRKKEMERGGAVVNLPSNKPNIIVPGRTSPSPSSKSDFFQGSEDFEGTSSSFQEMPAPAFESDESLIEPDDLL